MRKIGEGETAIARRLTAAAVHRPLALIRHLLRLAPEEWEAIHNVPRIRLENEPQGRLRWLTQEEITRLLNAAAKSRNKELRAAVIVALNTGLRRGELLVGRLEGLASSQPASVSAQEPVETVGASQKSSK